MSESDRSRERILANLRAALKRREPLGGSERAALIARTAGGNRAVQPRIDGDPVERFCERLRMVSGIVTRLDDLEQLANLVASHLDAYALPPRLVVAADERLDGIPWSNRLQVERRAAIGSDRCSVNCAFAAVAETGSVVLLSGADSPTTLNFLPEDHLVVVPESCIVPNLEDVWSRLRAQRPDRPRTVNFITGPSKTADVEFTLQEGAHGPRRIHAMVVARL